MSKEAPDNTSPGSQLQSGTVDSELNIREGEQLDLMQSSGEGIQLEDSIDRNKNDDLLEKRSEPKSDVINKNLVDKISESEITKETEDSKISDTRVSETFINDTGDENVDRNDTDVGKTEVNDSKHRLERHNSKVLDNTNLDGDIADEENVTTETVGDSADGDNLEFTDTVVKKNQDNLETDDYNGVEKTNTEQSDTKPPADGDYIDETEKAYVTEDNDSKENKQHREIVTVPKGDIAAEGIHIEAADAPDSTSESSRRNTPDPVKIEHTDGGEDYEDDFEEPDNNQLNEESGHTNNDNETNIHLDQTTVENDKENLSTKENNSGKGDILVEEKHETVTEQGNSNTNNENNGKIKKTNSANGDTDKIEPEHNLTTVVIAENGIPQVTVTTVPDRPPSSQASEPSDPFEDFDFEGEKPKVEEEDKHVNKIRPSNTESEGSNDNNDNNKVNINVNSDEQKMDTHNNDDQVNEDHEGQNDMPNSNETQSGIDSTHSNSNSNDRVIPDSGDSDKNEIDNTRDDIVSSREENTNRRDSNTVDETNTVTSTQNERKSEMDESKTIETNGSQTALSAEGNTDEKVNKQKDTAEENKVSDSPKAQTENMKQPEPEPVIQHQESPLDQVLKRNVEIDGTVESISQLEANVVAFLKSMKDVMKHYQDVLKLQTLKDFTMDLGKFRGDFLSVNEAFKSYSIATVNINQNLKELRLVTDDVKTQLNRKFQSEDLSTWVDIPPEKEKEKEKLQDEAFAAEKAALAKAAEARHAVATASVGVAEANQFVAEMEILSAEAEATANKAAAQAEFALVLAEEARVAAEEKRRVEEAAKRRAEERARIKAIEEEKKKALEEMQIQQEAAKKGTTVDDERKQFMEEKAIKEAKRRNPNNWPRYAYDINGIDFNPGVGCIIRAIEGSMRKTDLLCESVDQKSGVLVLRDNEELVSNIIHIKQTETDTKLIFDEPLSIAIPVSINRVFLGREAVIKQMDASGTWRELPAADVQFDDFREMKFIEARCRSFGVFVAVLRLKKDTIQLTKKGNKAISTVDSRISFTCKPGGLKHTVNSLLEVQAMDANSIHDLKLRAPKECENLLTSSSFIRMSLPVRKFEKSVTVTIPLPQLPTRPTRPNTGIAREPKGLDVRPATARPAPKKDEESLDEDIHFVYKDVKNGWTVNNKLELVQPKNKDIVTFDLLEPYERFILLRTKMGVKDSAVEKMVNLLERTVAQRNVKVFLRQRHDDVSDVIMSCTSSVKCDRALKELDDNGYVEGPLPSQDLILKEGQKLYLKFRGNIKCVSKNPRLDFHFNSHIKAACQIEIEEMDTFAQKALPCYRGFIQVFTKSLIPRPLPDGAPKNAQPEMVEADILLSELLVELPKPEIEPPKPLVTAPIPLKDGPLTNDLFRQLATELGKEWKDVATHLNLKPMRIQAILRQNVNKDTPQTRYDMLVTWAKRIPKSVDKILILSSALQASGRTDLAEEVRYQGSEYKQERMKKARVSYLRQAFVKVAKTVTVFNKWQSFAKSLGVPEEEIKRIDDSGGSGQEKCFNSLETWKNVAGEEATIPELATKLKYSKQDQLSREVESILVL